ncbi:hypothetical protein [Pseudomonas sp. 2995-3]|uniref:hypothetical protein n=1 Tax=Pseudomonas sp. 2995-3 TaxID=1712680 RepID=UPI0011798C3B|nr:hypothetical protein [Pseudomonas sp. 2995-3]
MARPQYRHLHGLPGAIVTVRGLYLFPSVHPPGAGPVQRMAGSERVLGAQSTAFEPEPRPC